MAFVAALLCMTLAYDRYKPAKYPAPFWSGAYACMAVIYLLIGFAKILA